ncbi:MAG TPA: prepilin-type N-terminal cleavage/methylation domain-containing protein [Polyangia bacterium]|nr:prepilin-type N-terminal cleavage/methylation domain-containing protein [Polyangia bacterium]
MTTRRQRAPRAQGGYTLIEVMVALMLSTIGLLGTLAVQMTVMSASGNSNDAAIATQLATQTLEELSARTLTAGPPVVDQLSASAVTGWAAPKYLNAQGVTSAQKDAAFRFMREVRIENQGVGNPYNVSVRVSYSLDSGITKTVRIDQERRKTW